MGTITQETYVRIPTNPEAISRVCDFILRNEHLTGISVFSDPITAEDKIRSAKARIDQHNVVAAENIRQDEITGELIQRKVFINPIGHAFIHPPFQPELHEMELGILAGIHKSATLMIPVSV